MASAFAHATVAATAARLFPTTVQPRRLIVLGILCALLPDLDIVAFAFGIPYDHPFGHRGFTHSLFFAVLLAAVITRVFYPAVESFSKQAFFLTAYFFVSTASHGVLDALTNGGLGVAFFAPFDSTRMFLPWRPIQVSPIGIAAFFSRWGLRVLGSESLWVGVPCLSLLAVARLVRRNRK